MVFGKLTRLEYEEATEILHLSLASVKRIDSKKDENGANRL